jgi:hypothetical protein
MSVTDEWNDDFDSSGEEFDFEPDDGEDLSPEEREFEMKAERYNSILTSEISRELSVLTNRELMNFMMVELDKSGFSENSELLLAGIEFNGSYFLTFYNIREEQPVKIATGCGNIPSLVEKWFLKNLTESMADKMFGPLGELFPSDMTDMLLNVLIDLTEWKAEKDGKGKDD